MRNEILAWYAYSESGAAAVKTAGTGHVNRIAALEAAQQATDPDAPSQVAGLFADMRRMDAEVNAQRWQHLFSRYGLEGLIDLAKSRRTGWPEKTTDETVADAIVNESLNAGYDPVSGLIGTVRKPTREFEPKRSMGVPPVRSGKRKKVGK
jgi:hypothetical protein